MLYQFILENLNFSVNIFAALVSSWVLWLYFDALALRVSFKNVVSVVGFALLSLSFVIQSVLVESALLANPVLAPELHLSLVTFVRVGAYLALIVSLLVDPLNSHPRRDKGVPATPKAAPSNLEGRHLGGRPAAVVIYAGGALSALVISKISLPILAIVVSLLYLRRATLGLETHLKPIALAFGILSLYEILDLGILLRETENANIFLVVQPFGALWLTERLTLLAAVLVLGKWNFTYLLKRLQSQIYMYYSLTVLIIFVLTTGVFTGLLVKNVTQELSAQLSSNVRVLELSLDTKREELLSDARVFASDPKLIEAVNNNDQLQLADLAQSFMLLKNVSGLTVVNSNGQVIARGEEVERIGESLSTDSLVRRGLEGEGISSVLTRDGVLAPEVALRALWPVLDGEESVTGAVLISVLIDNAYVDGIKSATDLDTTVYGDERISATTFVDESGSRRVGLKETNKNILDQVLVKGEAYSGAVDIVNTPFYAAYLPLLDLNSDPVGMLNVSEPQSAVLRTAGRSIQLTFVFTGFLWAVAIVPSYLISRSISKQLER